MTGNPITLDDPDAGPLASLPNWDFSLSVTAGTLALSTTDGLIGSGNGTGELRYRGTIAALDAALEGLRYTWPADYQGMVTVNLEAQSDGAAPIAGQLSLSFFLVTTTADAGPGSLRQAIEDADASTTPAVIDFDIAGSGVHTIGPLSALPPVTGSVLIDGFSQPGYAGSALIALDSQAAGTADSLAITGATVVATGLAIDGITFPGGLPGTLTIQSDAFPRPGATVDSYRIDLTTDQLLIAQVHPTGITARLALVDAQGRLLVQSDGVAPGNGDALIDQNLPPGTYFLQVFATGAAGDYSLVAQLKPASAPFQPIHLPSVGVGTYFQELSFTTGDFNGDGIPDLAAYDGVHLGAGDGTFADPRAGLGLYPAEVGPEGMISGDWNGDGKLDLALATGGEQSYQIALLLGNGDGTFQSVRWVSTGQTPVSLAAGDFNGDGKLDLAVVNWAWHDIAVLLGNGDGTFQPEKLIEPGDYPDRLVAGDFNGDGKTDLAVGVGNGVRIFLSNGDGTFQNKGIFSLPAYAYPASLAVGDFNGDGKLDLAAAEGGLFNTPALHNVAVMLGNGDGTFQAAREFDTGPGSAPNDLVARDFNGDGKLDLATADYGSGGVSVLLGNGDGTFGPFQFFAAGAHPNFLSAGDFNRDGRLDLAVDDGVSTVSVLLGSGDGAFQQPPRVATGSNPVFATAGDFNRDGRLDIVVANSGSNDISVLLGNGDGTFGPQDRIAVGDQPSYVAVGDFNNDGRLDLAVANSGSGDISVLLGRGDGTFLPQTRYATGNQPTVVIAIDVDGDGRLDLVVNPGGDDPAVLLNNGDGTFRAIRAFSPYNPPIGLFPGDFSGDGWRIMIAEATGSAVSWDFNGDGRPDQVSVNASTNDVSVSLANADGTFVPASLLASGRYSTPLVADFNGDGTDDVCEINSAGEILYRQGRPKEPGTFDPPIKINPGSPARDLAYVVTAGGPMLAAVDDGSDTVSLYRWTRDGFVKTASLATGRLPAQIGAADLNGDGQDDLVVRNAGDGSLSVFFASQLIPGNVIGPINPELAPSIFLPALTLPVGLGASDMTLVDTTGDGVIDIVVTNKLTGQVSILRNQGDGTFAAPQLYRAGTGVSGLDNSSGSLQAVSLDGTAGVAAGPFTAGGLTGLVTINAGSKTSDLLVGLGGGRFANPVALETGSDAQVVRAGDFNGDGNSDLALITSQGVSVLLSDGRGGFSSPTTYDAGPDPTGLSTADINGDGHLDLVVGDPYGDVLVLLGRGDGTFQPYRTTDQAVALAVADLNGDGVPDFVFANQGLDRVTIDYSKGPSAVLADRSSGLLAPGAVLLADMNGDGIRDLIIADSGSNSILVYPGLGNGQFGQALNDGHGFFAGTNPTGLTVADVNGDGKLDLLVANTGSNDVSVLLGQGTGTNWTLAPGPRIKTAGGPVATAITDVNGDGRPDLVVTNGQANNVQVFTGVGGGFFNDQNPITFSVGANPGPVFIGNFDGKPDILTVNSGSNDLTLISDFNGPDPVISTISSGGLDPVTAFAFSTGGGFEDLVVGNNGDGVLALFAGGPNGLTMISTEFEPNLPSPTDLAFATLNGGQVEFYAATEGQESAVLVGLSLSGPTTPGSVPPPPPPPSESNVAQLIPLSESASTLALVGTLLTLTLESPGSEANIVPSESGATVPGASSSIGQSLTDLGGDFEELSQPVDARDSAGFAGNPPAPAASGWERFMLGLDEALEQFRQEFRGRIGRAPEKPVDRDENAPPADRSGSQDGRTIRRPAPDSPPREVEDERDSGGERGSRVGAVDAAIESYSADRLDRFEWPSPSQDAPERPSTYRPGLAVPLVAATVVSGLGSLVRPPRPKRKPAAVSLRQHFDRWARRAGR
jgi:hypothetical protein